MHAYLNLDHSICRVLGSLPVFWWQHLYDYQQQRHSPSLFIINSSVFWNVEIAWMYTICWRITEKWITFWTNTRKMSRLVTKPTKWLCAQRSLRSTWASAQSDQSLRCPHEQKIGPLATHWAHSEDSDQTGRMHRVIWVFAGRTLILLVLSYRGSKTIR